MFLATGLHPGTGSGAGAGPGIRHSPHAKMSNATDAHNLPESSTLDDHCSVAADFESLIRTITIIFQLGDDLLGLQ